MHTTKTGRTSMLLVTLLWSKQCIEALTQAYVRLNRKILSTTLKKITYTCKCFYLREKKNHYCRNLERKVFNTKKECISNHVNYEKLFRAFMKQMRRALGSREFPHNFISNLFLLHFLRQNVNIHFVFLVLQGLNTVQRVDFCSGINMQEQWFSMLKIPNFYRISVPILSTRISMLLFLKCYKKYDFLKIYIEISYQIQSYSKWSHLVLFRKNMSDASCNSLCFNFSHQVSTNKQTKKTIHTRQYKQTNKYAVGVLNDSMCLH